MTTVLRIGNQTIATAEILPFLVRSQLLPQFWRELIVDQAIAPIQCTPEEVLQACEQFFQQHQLTSESTVKAWMQRYHINSEQLETVVTRNLKIAKFKQATWGTKLESYFLNCKSRLDKVIYSLIRTQDPGIAQELYFRIQAGEASFAECARSYSQGPEVQTSGIIGPVELSVPHPTLAKMLSVSQPGQLLPPTRIGEWLVIVRLEKLISAQLDEPMRAKLLDSLFETWLSEQMNQMHATDQQISSNAPISL